MKGGKKTIFGIWDDMCGGKHPSTIKWSIEFKRELASEDYLEKEYQDENSAEGMRKEHQGVARPKPPRGRVDFELQQKQG